MLEMSNLEIVGDQVFSGFVVKEEINLGKIILKILYEATDLLDNHKALGLRLFISWALKASKFLIGRQLQVLLYAAIYEKKIHLVFETGYCKVRK